MIKNRRMSIKVERARALYDQLDVVSWNVDFSGEAGSLIWDGRDGRSAEILGTTDDIRSRKVGLAGGAMNAIEKSVSPEGEDGVTMMAGNAAFSSTRGRVRSESIDTTITK